MFNAPAQILESRSSSVPLDLMDLEEKQPIKLFLRGSRGCEVNAISVLLCSELQMNQFCSN